MACEVAPDHVSMWCTKLYALIAEIKEFPDDSDKTRHQSEKLCESFNETATFFQELPHLLDKHLKFYVEQLIDIVKKNFHVASLKLHTSFKCLRLLAKTRGQKSLMRHLPHSIEEVPLVLQLLSEIDPLDFQHWETSYILLLWLSLLLLIPLSIERFDVSGGDDNRSTARRIYNFIKIYLLVPQKASDAAAMLAVNFLIRDEVYKVYATDFIQWCFNQLIKPDATSVNMLSTSLALAYLFKSGKRENLRHHGVEILKKLRETDLLNSPHELVVKHLVKLNQRIALLFLKPKPATWRYSRGKRFLSTGLGSEIKSSHDTDMDNESDDDSFEEYFDELEIVVETLLNGLRHDSTNVRWSSAKGIGRVSERLPKEMADQIFSSVFELFSFGEQDNAWHGGCLTLAELGRRQLIQPTNLEPVINVVRKALVYDELKGMYFAGAHVRDAACYICWSFARAYNADAMKPFIVQLSSDLVCVALFDREVSCRRAAAAAFQEHVGRQGVFPNGIDIIAVMDYFEVGNRTRAFLQVANQVAKYADYRKSLVQHLLQYKVVHWDSTMRDLAAETLSMLCRNMPVEDVYEAVLPKLMSYTFETSLYQKHGSILAFSTLLNVFRENLWPITDDISFHIKQVTELAKSKVIFRNVDGELYRLAYCLLIENTSSLKGETNIGDNQEIVNLWLDIVLETLAHTSEKIRASAVKTLPVLYSSHIASNEQLSAFLVKTLMNNLRNQNESVRIGAMDAIAVLPFSAFKDFEPSDVFYRIVTYLKNDLLQQTALVEARASALKCATRLFLRLKTQDLIKPLYECLLLCINDYTETTKGDVGLIVRETSIHCIKTASIEIIQSTDFELPNDISTAIVMNLLLLCAGYQEQIRVLSYDCVTTLVNLGINAQDRELLRSALTSADDRNNLLELTLQALPIEAYTKSIWIGLATSTGNLTVKTSNRSRDTLSKYLKTISNDSERCSIVINGFCEVFTSEIDERRLFLPLIKTASYLVETGRLDNLPLDTRKSILKLAFDKRKNSSDAVKITTCAALICNFIRFKDTARAALIYIVILICTPIPKVRMEVSDAFNIAMITYGDNVFGESDEEMNKYENFLSLLQGSQWNSNVAELKPIRDKLCSLLGIPAPVQQQPKKL